MKKFCFVILTLTAVLLANYTLYAAERLKVSASFYHLAHFAEQVGGEYVEVSSIVPTGIEPHEYEPTPRDIREIWNSDVFIFHGAGLDPWADGIRDIMSKRGIRTLKMTEHFDLIRGDPHIWLDPILAIKEVRIIRDIFILADPEHSDNYRRNSNAYSYKLTKLHEMFSNRIKSCDRREIIVSHDAFRYLARRYGLITYAISGISPEYEPSPRSIIELSRIVKRKNIGFIFFETLASPRLAEAIARETGAGTLVLNPLEGLTRDDIRKGKTYISIMEENLRNLLIALSCN
jgi:zinc transport system substrate-binding protein